MNSLLSIFHWIPFVAFVIIWASCNEPKNQRAADTIVSFSTEEIAQQNAIYEANRSAEEEANLKARQEESIRESNERWIRRYCMTENELEAFLLVKKYTFNAIMRKSEDELTARARAEVATARAFGMEPANWAKIDLVNYVEKEKQFHLEIDEVDRRLKEAKQNSSNVEMAQYDDKDWNPLKSASLYWSQDNRDKEPNHPLSIAYENEHKVAYEREQLYHKYGKETPEEKLGGAVAILLVMGMIGFEVAPSAGARAALSNLGRAQSALALGESEAAFISMGRARSIVVSAELENTALTSIRAAEEALTSGNIGKAAAYVDQAQLILSPSWGIAQECMLVVMASDEIGKQLQYLQETDRKINDIDRLKIEKFSYFESAQVEEIKILKNDLLLANKFLNDFRELVAKGEFIQKPDGDRSLRSDCKTGN